LLNINTLVCLWWYIGSDWSHFDGINCYVTIFCWREREAGSVLLSPIHYGCVAYLIQHGTVWDHPSLFSSYWSYSDRCLYHVVCRHSQILATFQIFRTDLAGKRESSFLRAVTRVRQEHSHTNKHTCTHTRIMQWYIRDWTSVRAVGSNGKCRQISNSSLEPSASRRASDPTTPHGTDCVLAFHLSHTVLICVHIMFVYVCLANNRLFHLIYLSIPVYMLYIIYCASCCSI